MIYKNSSHHTAFDSTMFECYVDLCFIWDYKNE